MADLWVELAAGQRRHGSHLAAGDNRRRARETMLRHAASGTALVARRGGSSDAEPEVVGFATFDLESERFAQDVTRSIVHNLYVREGDRGEGIGGALLGRAEAVLADQGADVVALEALAGNEAARRFYRRHGYAPHRVEMEKSIESDSLTTDD